MTVLPPAVADAARDLEVALSFYTRLPLPLHGPVDGPAVARAGWAAPIAGAVIGLVGALVYFLAHAAGLAPIVAAALAVAATLVVTGALHEDGLADTADGFGGGATRERKLEIMRDSRIGTFGACALVLSIVLRTGALASLNSPLSAAAALIAAHALARGTIPMFMRIVPPARADGLAAGAGPPDMRSAIVAGLLGVAAAALGLGPLGGSIAVVAVALASVAVAILCARQIGGQTGDTLGALEQANEIAILLIAAARV